MKLALVLSAGVLAVGCSNGREAALRAALSQPHVRLSESVAIAEQSVPGGVGIEAWVMVEGDPELSVQAVAAGQVRDVRLSLGTGEVLSNQSLRAGAEPCPGSIPLAEAITIAEAQVGGEAAGVMPDDDDACLREIQVLAGDTLWEVKLAPDGAVVEIEVSDEDED